MHQSVEARLAAAGIRLAVETASHYLFTRDNFMVLLERRTNSVGSTGMLTEHGLAYLIWRDGRAYLKSKGAENPATDEQIAAIRQFSSDVKAALSEMT